MSAAGSLVLYSVLVLLASLAGGWIPHLVRLTHTRMQLALSFVAGAMLGVGILHLLPHAFMELGSIDQTVGWMLGGFLLMFFIERLFHFHHHDAPLETPAAAAGHAHHHDHAHDHAHDPHAVQLNWVAALLGLSLHSLLDGVALAASVAADTQPGHTNVWPGVAVMLAVVLHKPFDSLTLGTLMAVGGKPARLRHVVNFLYALAVPCGILLFWFGLSALGHTVIGTALAFAAGMFLCIATSDLLPELHFHSHDRFKLSTALLLGIALAWSIGLLEGGHDHGPALPHIHDHPHEAHEHDAHNH